MEVAEAAEVGGEAPPPPPGPFLVLCTIKTCELNYIFVMPRCLSVSIQAASLGCYVYVN